MNKSVLRKKYLEIRKNITDKDIKSNEIFNRLIQLEEFNNANVIAFYYPLRSEVNTLRMIKYSLENNKTVLLPKVIGEYMVFYKINSFNNLKKSNFGIMEPEGGIIFDKNSIDLIVLPGVCFDRNLNRIGFGKGYYDRYLEGYIGQTIGLCFEEQISEEEIQTSENDIKLKYIITEKNIYS